MANDIRAGRTARITSMGEMQKDGALFAVTEEIARYLEANPLPRVTLSDVAGALSAAGHAHVTSNGPKTWYEGRWDPHTHHWVRICHSHGTISIKDRPDEDPILVQVDDSATYA